MSTDKKKTKNNHTADMIYRLSKSPEGKVFLDWLRKTTIETPIGTGTPTSEGMQIALNTQRQLGRHDIYFEIMKIINSVIKSHEQ